MARAGRISLAERAAERSLIFAVSADIAILVPMWLTGVLGGSLTMLAEAIRGSLMLAIEFFGLSVLRHIHRGTLVDLEFGTGKLEQIANLVIGTGMLGGAAWIAAKSVAIVAGERALGTPLGLALAAIAGAGNAYVNIIAWAGVRRAARGSNSIVMHAQLTARIAKLVSSLIVLGSLTLAAFSTDEEVVAWADASGSLFVAAFIVFNASGLLKSAIPDLLDRSAGTAVRAVVDRVLADHAGDYRRLERVRTRRSGRIVFIELALGFEAGLAIAEVDRRIEALKTALQREIAEAEITVLARASAEAGEPV
jgi:divalent metal cation (Fe/Co/Zn/Cd) transporter